VKARRLFTPLRLAVAGIFALVVAVIVLLSTSSSDFLIVPDRAHPLAELVKVPGREHGNVKGGIYYVDVLERKASLLERLFPGIRQGAELVQHDDLAPPGVSDRQRFEADRLDMRLSQQVASAVALRALGYHVTIKEKGVRVALVYGRTHATGVLHPDDVIVAADGKRIRSAADLHEALAREKVGDKVALTFLRNARIHHATIATSADPFDGTRAILGIQPQPALAIKVPYQIGFNLGNVGGPSAGLAFALQILEERGRDVDHGYKVAATGEIQLDGSVTRIGGIKQKTIGARKSHVDVFLVPVDGDNARDAKRYAHGLRIIPVKSFQQALQALATLPPKP
jgi:PDZ domain-containing protein